MLPAVADFPSSQYLCDRAVDGIAAVFLALKRRPVIRYQRTSDIAKRIAQEAAVSMLLWKISCFLINLIIIDVICVTSIRLSGTLVVPFVVLKVFIC